MLGSSRATSLRGIIPVLALVVACLLWGTSDAAAKRALDSIPPVTLAALRFAIASLVLWPLHKRSHKVSVPIREALPLGLIGIFGVFILQNFGLDRIAAANASLLQGATPALTLIIAAVLIGERIGLRRGIAIAAAAIGILAMSGMSELGPGAVGIGDGLMLASMVAFGFFVVLSKGALQRYGAIPVVFAIAVSGALALLPAAALEIAVVQPQAPELGAFGLAIYLGVFCSAVAFALWGFALEHVEIGCFAAFDALIPLTGCATAVVLLGDQLTRGHLLGGAAILGGLFLMACEPKPELSHRPKVRRTARIRQTVGTAAQVP